MRLRFALALLAVGCEPAPSVAPDPTEQPPVVSATATAEASAEPVPSLAPSASAVASVAPVDTPAEEPAPTIEYSPPKPYEIAISGPPSWEFKVHPLTNGSVLAVATKKDKVRAVYVITGEEAKQAKELMKGLPDKPTRIVGSYPDALWVTSGKSLHFFAKDKWTEVSSKGPFQIGAVGSSVLALSTGSKSPSVELVAPPGATAEKLEPLPQRDKKCAFTPGALVPMPSGPIAILGADCAHWLTFETFSPKDKTWTGTKASKALLFTEETSASAVTPTELSLFTTRMFGDGEPGTVTTRASLKGGVWKESKKFFQLNERPEVDPAYAPFEKESGKMVFSGGDEIVNLGDKRWYAPGWVTPQKSDEKKASVVLASHAIKK